MFMLHTCSCVRPHACDPEFTCVTVLKHGTHNSEQFTPPPDATVIAATISAIATLPGAAPDPHLDRRLIGPPLLLKHAVGSSEPARSALFMADFYFYIRMTSAPHYSRLCPGKAGVSVWEEALNRGTPPLAILAAP